jgi:hypothetical protein
MSKREALLKAVEEAELDYESVKYQHSHESSIALRCLEQAQERLDQFDGVTDAQIIKNLERQLVECMKLVEFSFKEGVRDVMTIDTGWESSLSKSKLNKLKEKGDV